MSGSRKRWVSAEVEARLVAQLDREAEARGVSRSEAIRRALRGWVSEAMEEDEERVTRAQANHRQLTNRLEFLVGMVREQDKRMERLAREPGRGAAAGPEPENGSEAPAETGPLAEAKKRARRTLR